MEQGWIKIHRQLSEKGYYKKSAYVHLWIHLLIKANHKDTEFFWNGKNQVVKRGQLLTGRNKLSQETGIKSGTIENILKVLENEQQIEQQKTTKFRLITVKKYNDYQKIEQQSDNKVTTNEQQNDTYKNVSNVKNDKKRDAPTPSQIMKAWISSKEKQLITINYLEKKGISKELALSEINKFISYWTELNKSGTKQRWETEKTFELQRRLTTWFNNIKKFNKEENNKIKFV